MLIYRCPGPHAGPAGTTYDYRASDDCPAGWHTSLVAAVAAHKGEKPPAPPPAPPAPDAPLKRAELEAEALKLGIRVDGRWSDARLAERILEAMDAAAKPKED